MYSNFSNKLKILIADDDDYSFRLFQAILRDSIVERARNGVEAVELFKNNNFDLVIMDIVMPIMNGIEATRLIREFDNETPIIGVSATISYLQEALDAGCNHTIEKPIPRILLLSLINQECSQYLKSTVV